MRVAGEGVGGGQGERDRLPAHVLVESNTEEGTRMRALVRFGIHESREE